MLYVTIFEAGELCSRDHELGTCGEIVVKALLDNVPTGHETSPQLSFPGPCWDELLEIQDGGHSAVLSLMLVDKDPLQPRLGRPPFLFGRVSLPLTAQAFTRHDSHPLEDSPGSQGFLTFAVSRRLPQRPCKVLPMPPPASEMTSRGGSDFCGVLVVSSGGSCARSTFDISVGTCAFASWTEHSPENTELVWGSQRRLLIVEPNPLLSAHATVDSNGLHQTARVESRLSGADGSQREKNLFLELHPPPLLLRWTVPASDHGRPKLHVRFFPAEFLRPGLCTGLSVHITLALASGALPLPLLVLVPVECFGDSSARREAAFVLARHGDSAEICLPDPTLLVNWSVWRIVPSAQASEASRPAPAHGRVGGEDLSSCECLIDIIALRLQIGAERTLTVPIGPHLAVLRVRLALLQVQSPRSVFGTAASQPDSSAAPANEGPAPGQGVIAGLVVHALAVHSNAVSRCLVAAGPEGGVLLGPLSRHSGRAFITAEPNSHGRVLVRAVLPEHGLAASAEALVGSGHAQLQWTFQSASGPVFAGALVSAVRWPVACGLRAAPVAMHVLRARIPRSVLPRLAPVGFWSDGGSEPSFVWTGTEGQPDEAFLPLSFSDEGLGSLQVRCGSALPLVSFSKSYVFATEHLMRPEGLTIFLPVLGRAEESLRRDDTVAFLFLPVQLRYPLIEPDPAPVPSGKAGVLLLQGFSAFVGLDKDLHDKDCAAVRDAQLRMEQSWKASPHVSISMGSACVSGTAYVEEICGAAFAWRPQSRGERFFNLTPHVLCMPFNSLSDNESGDLELQLGFQLVCSHCGSCIRLHAVPRAPLLLDELLAWRSFTVHMGVLGKDSRKMWRSASACARMLICATPMLRTQGGTLSLALGPLQGFGRGVGDVLACEAGGVGGEDVAMGLRLAIAGTSTAAVFDGRAGASQQLRVETGDVHAESYVTLELQTASGARRLLARVLLAALEMRGDLSKAAVYPVFLTPSASFALVACCQSRAPEWQVQHAPPSAVADAWAPPDGEAQLAAEVSRLRRLEQREHAAVRPREDGRAPRAASAHSGRGTRADWAARSAGARRHPFLTRGQHLWTASASTSGAGAARQAHPKRAPTQPEARPSVVAQPDGWDSAEASARGPAYHSAFLGSQREAVHGLRERVRQVQIQLEKRKKHLARLRQYLSVAEGGVAGGHAGAPGGGTGAPQLHVEEGVNSDALAGHASRSSELASVCSRCSSAVSRPQQFCTGCLPSVIDEAGALLAEAGCLLLDRAALRCELEQQREEAQEQAAVEVRLTERASLHVGEGATEAQALSTLSLLGCLRTLLWDTEQQACHDADQIEVLSGQEEQAMERSAQASSLWEEAVEQNTELSRSLHPAT